MLYFFKQISTQLFIIFFLSYYFAYTQNNPSIIEVSETDSGEYKVMVVEQGAGQVKVFDYSGTLIDSTKVGYNPHEIAISPEGDLVVVSNFGVEDYDNTLGIPGENVATFPVNKIQKVENWAINPDKSNIQFRAPHGVKFRPPDGIELFVNAEYGNSMLVMNSQNGEFLRSFPLASANHNFEFSPSGDTLWLLAGDNGLYQYLAGNGQLLSHFQTSSAVRGITFFNNRELLILSCVNEVIIIGASDLRERKRFTNLGVNQIIYSCLTPDHKELLAPCPYDNVVLRIDLNSGKVLQRISCGKAPIYVKIAPDQKSAFVSNALDNHMSVIHLENFQVTSFGKVLKPNDFAFVP